MQKNNQMMNKILVMGLPGAGKSYLASRLASYFMVPHHNADTYREYYNDWDFSIEGRLRQATRMSQQFGILDFVCPTNVLRAETQPDFVIWMNTIDEGRFEDTNALFAPPIHFDIELNDHNESDDLLSLAKAYSDKNGTGMVSLSNFLRGL